MLKEYNDKIKQCRAEVESAENAAREAQQVLTQSGRTLSSKPLDLKAIAKAQANKAAATELLDNSQVAIRDARVKLDEAERAKESFINDTMPAQTRLVENLKTDLPAAHKRLADAKLAVGIAQNDLAGAQARLKKLSRQEAMTYQQTIREREIQLADSQHELALAEKSLVQLQQRINSKEALLEQWRNDPDFLAERQTRLRQAHGISG